jgi:hypothetical protein
MLTTPVVLRGGEFEKMFAGELKLLHDRHAIGDDRRREVE